MELVYLILFLISGWSICAEAQLQNGRHTESSLQSPDMIFFEDRLRQDVKSVTERTDVFVQKSVEGQTVVTAEPDSYSQAVYAAQNQNYAQYSVVPLPQTSDPGNRMPSPSYNLQPPSYNNSPNYYGSYNDNNNSLLKNSDQNAPQVVVPTVAKELQITNASLALTNFGINVLRTIGRRGINVVVSPFSIAELLSLLQQGALGLTQQQISDALQMTPKASVQTFQQFNENFKKRGSSHNTLKVANNIYVADAFELNKAFKNLAIHAYDSEVTPMRFSRSQDAVNKINQWVSQKTKNKITELLNEDAVGDNTQVVLVNAVYFKGLWAVKFKADSTLNRDFYFNDVAKKQTPFMRMRKIFRTGTDESNNAQVIILPFENEQYSMMIVLPSPVSSVDALISTLTPVQLAAYNSFTPKEVDLEIPKFIARADTDLSPVLRKMGVTTVFGPQSDLSLLGTFRTYSPQLSSALHTAMLSIDEEGGTASAATSFAVVALSYDDPSISFKANRPFLAVLWDNESALPLFMAKIHDPTS